MAKMNPDFLRQVVIDGQATMVPSSSQIVDVVARDVTGITTLDTRTGRSHLIPRANFNGAVPAGFTTHLTPMGKG